MIRVQQADFDPAVELSLMAGGRHDIGGVCLFVGLVREMAESPSLTSMTIEHYPGMTERQLARLEATAHARWQLKESRIVHRYGTLLPGDRIVMVAAASAHRNAAFEACRFLIDWLKTEAPFWKREETIAGARWVDAKASDQERAQNWSATNDAGGRK